MAEQVGDAAEPSSGSAVAAALEPSGPIVVKSFADVDALPEAVVAFLGEAGAADFFRSLPWYRALLRTAGPAGDHARIFAALGGARPLGVLVTRERLAAGRLKTHMLLGPAPWAYAPAYGPVCAGRMGEAGAAALGAIAAAVARMVPRVDVVRLDALDLESPEVETLAAAFRKAGLLVQRFLSYHGAFEDVRGLTLADYLARRSARLRQAALRSRRRLARSGRSQVTIERGGAGLKSALVDYALVDLQSRHDAEAYPETIAALAEAAAAGGALRLGLLHVDGKPAAAQIWIVAAGRATLLRQRRVEAYRKLSIGTVLMLEMLDHLLTVDRIEEVDFGPGGEAFKTAWLRRTRRRGGLIVFNPRGWRGLAAAARHIGGHAALNAARLARSLARRVLRRA